MFFILVAAIGSCSSGPTVKRRCSSNVQEEKTSAKGCLRRAPPPLALTVIFSILSFIYLILVFLVVINSFKSNASVNTETFAFPNAEQLCRAGELYQGPDLRQLPVLKSVGYSLLITIVSTALILLCTSMAAWYIARVGQRLFARWFIISAFFRWSCRSRWSCSRWHARPIP